jgi:ribosomal protein S18 acetylase RimI-like enzyme
MVYHLAVAAACRHQGVGRSLMAELESRLRAKGCLKYYLLVVPGNELALDFYRHLGWDVMPMHILGKVIEPA